MAYSYREVLKEPRALGVFGAALLGRLSFAMGPLSLVLFVRAATGSFAVAGAASAATAGRAGEAAAVLLSGVAGAAAPPLAASMRVLWSALVGGGPRLQTAFALDTVVEGALFTLGPLLASGLAAAFAPAAALAAVAALAVVGTLAFISSPVSKGWIPTVGEGRAGWAGAMSGRGIRTLVISLTGFGAAVGPGGWRRARAICACSRCSRWSRPRCRWPGHCRCSGWWWWRSVCCCRRCRAAPMCWPPSWRRPGP